MSGLTTSASLPAEPPMSIKPNAARHIYAEPLDTPGIVPIHLKRAVNLKYPLFEIAQRLLLRMKPDHIWIWNLEAILTVVALYNAAVPAYRSLKEFIMWAGTSEITVSEFDPIAKDIMEWMSFHVMAKRNTTGAMLMTGQSLDPLDNMYRNIYRHEPGNHAQNGSEETQIVPAIGQRLFWIGFRPFLFSRTGGSSPPSYGRHSATVVSAPSTDEQGEMRNAIVIRTPGWNLDPLRAFIRQCHDFKISNKNETTTMYFAKDKIGDYSYMPGGMWSAVTKATRKLDTVDMDEKVKTDLIGDAEHYYSDESRKYFADCGIPYRRGFMFYGPPGTGKTSFSAALAGHLRCDVYMINLATGDISDGRLHSLFLALPRKCVVVIEDIDSAGIGRDQGPAAPAVPPQVVSDKWSDAELPPLPRKISGMLQQNAEKRPRNMVTLSGLLNAIDGNASAEGRLLIMTSNNPDVLDEALTRPGRIDKKIHFGKLMASAAEGLFKRLIGRTLLAKSNFSDHQIDEFAKAFSERLPEDTFTPAQVQNFLHTCRGDPEKAMQELDAWVVATLSKNVHADKKAMEGKAEEVKKMRKKAKVQVPIVNGTTGTVETTGLGEP